MNVNSSGGSNLLKSFEARQAAGKSVQSQSKASGVSMDKNQMSKVVKNLGFVTNELKEMQKRK
jgi:hypothetical protein